MLLQLLKVSLEHIIYMRKNEYMEIGNSNPIHPIDPKTGDYTDGWHE